jgi:hypothetical protein
MLLQIAQKQPGTQKQQGMDCECCALALHFERHRHTDPGAVRQAWL